MKAQPSPSLQTTDASARVKLWQQRFETVLLGMLDVNHDAPAQLWQAMRYATLDGGKRMRPLLVYAAGHALGLEEPELDHVAGAVEIIHAYSLIHDDLPAMDDDELRRGRPTCHRAFDEATAILAGDALQALAFEILATHSAGSKHPDRLAAIIGRIARACGSSGMAGGQALDLAAVGQQLSLEALEQMHRLKTGALIEVCATAPAEWAAASPAVTARLARYGQQVGLAFQIHDDILDVTGNAQTTGKTSHKDAALDKPTFPAILGLQASADRARQLRDLALAELRGFPGDCGPLAWLARYAIDRDS